MYSLRKINKTTKVETNTVIGMQYTKIIEKESIVIDNQISLITILDKKDFKENNYYIVTDTGNTYDKLKL